MSIGSTRKVTSSSSSAPKAESRFSASNNHSQFVENIDTTNNVLVSDERERHNETPYNPPQQKRAPTNFSSAAPDISTSIEALALSGIYDESAEDTSRNKHQVNVYNNNQLIVKDEEIERTGRNYLKHFYEKNEHLVDVDELV